MKPPTSSLSSVLGRKGSASASTAASPRASRRRDMRRESQRPYPRLHRFMRTRTASSVSAECGTGQCGVCCLQSCSPVQMPAAGRSVQGAAVPRRAGGVAGRPACKHTHIPGKQAAQKAKSQGSRSSNRAAARRSGRSATQTRHGAINLACKAHVLPSILLCSRILPLCRRRQSGGPKEVIVAVCACFDALNSNTGV